MSDVLFLGHGSPMNAIEDNDFTKAHIQLGNSLKNKFRGIITVSAHWLTEGTLVQASESPEQIYDFSGFPKELYGLKYQVKGSPEFANTLTQKNKDANFKAQTTTEWGCDHGIWSLLFRMFPEGGITCVQVSIDVDLSFDEYLRMGKTLASFRDDGWLILASGNIVHNLRRMNFSPSAAIPDWAQRFERWVDEKVQGRDFGALVTFKGMSEQDMHASHPSLDHYVPLIYALGAVSDDDLIRAPIKGFQLSTISMQSYQFTHVSI